MMFISKIQRTRLVDVVEFMLVSKHLKIELEGGVAGSEKRWRKMRTNF